MTRPTGRVQDKYEQQSVHNGNCANTESDACSCGPTYLVPYLLGEQKKYDRTNQAERDLTRLEHNAVVWLC